MNINFNDYAIKLSKGSHCSPSEGLCIMECVAYIEGEKHTDHPKCACPVITAFAIPTNDRMSESKRSLLLPFVLRIAGSKSTFEVEQKRAYLCADYAVRVFAPIHLEIAGLKKEAEILRNCEKIIDKKSAKKGEKAANAAASYAAFVASAAAFNVSTDAAYATNAAADAVYAVVNAPYATATHTASTVCATNAISVLVRDNLIAAQLQLLDEMLKLTESVEATPKIAKRLQELETITAD